jgi:hypothetical protein
VRVPHPARLGLLAALCGPLLTGAGATLSDPAAEDFNSVAGTQTFGPLYQFNAGQTKLVETADAILAMGSRTVKFYLGAGFPRQYEITLGAAITNLTALAQNEPSCRHALDLPFRHFILWIYCFTPGGDTYWKDGLSASERTKEYNEVYALTRHLLTNYNNSGKSFYFGHWEGDWHLLDNYVTTNNPSPTAIQGMRDWLNTRQQAVDDAQAATPHTNVRVYVYTEANRIRDAMVNGPESNQRLINTVVPYVTNLDFVSYSSYDMQNLSAAGVTATLDYAASQLPTAKAASIPGRRVFIGEYGWGDDPPDVQESKARAYLQKLLGWGVPFALWWEMYNNEPGRDFSLINSNGVVKPNYFLHQRLCNAGKLWVAEFRQNNGRVPTAAEYQAWAVAQLNAPLPPPVSLEVRNLPVATTPALTTLAGSLRQGVYGEDGARVRVFWGASDGGTNKAAWEHVADFGANSRFGTVTFATNVTGLTPVAPYFYRFHASNAVGEAWAPETTQFLAGVPPPATFISTGAVWKYFDQNVDLGAGWRAPEFNDSAWPSGPAQLGFGDGDEATVVNTNRLRITTYFRRAFVVTNAAAYETLAVRLLRDDGAVGYLNGVEVFRSNMPTNGAITASTLASATVQGGDESTNFYTYSGGGSLLREGTNVIAVEVHQATTNSTDLSFDLELTALPFEPETLTDPLIPPGSVWKYLDNGSNQGTNWTGVAFNDGAWASGRARLGYGGDGELTTVSYGPSSSSKYLTTYFRRAFELADPAIYRRVTLRVVRDDGARVYLNGTEVFRSNLTNGTVTFTNTALTAISGADEFIALETNVSPALLRTGLNVVAAEVHQSSGGSSDLGFDLELAAEYKTFPAGLPLGIARSNTSVVVSWSRPAVGHVLESAAPLPGTNAWRTATNAVQPRGTGNAVIVTPTATNEFFRLVHAPVDASTLNGKLMFGYQGWFACSNDTSPPSRWIHWFRSQVPAATNATFDFWPDTSELEPDELFPTLMTLTNGQPARLYAAHRQKTVVRHFRWMYEAGLDGVFLQRFTSELGSRELFAWRNQVALNVRTGAEAYGRVFAIMYDISGQNSNTLVATVQNDWQHLTGTLRLTNSTRYLRHQGRPVVAIWGLGFTDRPGTPTEAQTLLDFFRTNGCTVMGGVPTNWRTLDGDSKTDPAWAAVYRSFDIISPWSVGRYSSDAGADNFKTTKIVPDLAEARANGRDYLPVVWPGFSWKNLNNGPLNQIPRRGGRFWWRQFYNAVSAGGTMVYGAMFDEVDEGTAMFKLVPTAGQLPAQGTFVPLNVDGESLPSDWYLRVAGEATRVLRGQAPLSASLPIAP